MSASATLHVVPPVDHVHVKKESAAGALCHTGSSAGAAVAGSTVTLQGCALGLAADGTEVAAGDVRVLWILNPTRPSDPGQIAFQQDSTDADGQARATVTSASGDAGRTTTVRFCVDEFPATGGGTEGNGICDAGEVGSGLPKPGLQADYTIEWTAKGGKTGPCAAGFNRIRGDQQNNLMIGTSGCDRILARGGNDILRGNAGNDILNGGKGVDRARGGPGRDRCPRTEKKKSC
jgi:Ca2+-binding RTX toxin-like protein